MSQWTHILGVIRFDTMSKNVWPKPLDEETVTLKENDFIHNIFKNTPLPEGSEGPIRVDTILTNRGPTVIITGDLRDFEKGDLQQIVVWLNGCLASVRKLAKENIMIWIRDSLIRCEVEHNETLYLIVRNRSGKDSDRFELTERA